ncbi:MAG: hypothetical protein P8J45_09230 [Phycisphaerales bacterium]|nr:hypothetical protein [Phycisphaerales bacterium]
MSRHADLSSAICPGDEPPTGDLFLTRNDVLEARSVSHDRGSCVQLEPSIRHRRIRSIPLSSQLLLTGVVCGVRLLAESLSPWMVFGPNCTP